MGAQACIEFALDGETSFELTPGSEPKVSVDHQVELRRSEHKSATMIHRPSNAGVDAVTAMTRFLHVCPGKIPTGPHFSYIKGEC